MVRWLSGDEGLARLMDDLSVDCQMTSVARYAQTALAAGSVQGAIDSANRYLTAVGREGKHYREALELLVKAERSLQEPVARRTETGAEQLATEAKPQAVAPSAPRIQKTVEAQTLLYCGKWNTDGYFQTASVESVTAFLAAGADPNARDEGKNTPLHEAAGSNENPAVTEVLLKAGADPGAKNKRDSTPLEIAKIRKNINVIEVLRDPTIVRERQLAAARSRRKSKSGSGPSLLGFAVGIAGGTAIASAGGGTAWCNDSDGS